MQAQEKHPSYIKKQPRGDTNEQRKLIIIPSGKEVKGPSIVQGAINKPIDGVKEYHFQDQELKKKEKA